MRRTLGLLAFVLLAASCSTKPPAEEEAPPVESSEKDLISGVGMILFQDLEGGFYGLVAADGATYDPLNLDDAFKHDSLRVRFQARRRTGVMTTRMWGQPVEILEMARLDNQ